jgi:hypothetical protein
MRTWRLHGPPCPTQNTQQFPHTSAEMLALVCNRFALPLPGLDPALPAPCPGCSIPLDCHGSHLLNCRNVSTKGAANQYNRQLMAHYQLATELSKITANKFFCVRTDPKDDDNCPILADGSRGRLDIIHVPRDNGPTVCGAMCPSPIRSPLQYLTATRSEATTLWKTPEFKNETSIWNPCVALLLSVSCYSPAFPHLWWCRN